MKTIVSRVYAFVLLIAYASCRPILFVLSFYEWIEVQETLATLHYHNIREIFECQATFRKQNPRGLLHGVSYEFRVMRARCARYDMIA